MATTVQVKLGERSYPIVIGRNVPLAATLDTSSRACVMIVTDSAVDAACGAPCQERIASRGFDCFRAVVPAGEATKSLDTAATLYGRAATARLDRAGVIVALGGGMVGDLAGFVAATYLRGVRFVQVPTTLLAMVDSSVGGKTAVNLPQGKNLVGAFYQPVEVDADLELLRTLPPREYVSGLAEAVKYGVIWDAAFFGFLEKHAEGLIARDLELLERVVGRCCEIKAEVVAMDERDIGPRAVLNFGHTLGHALENVDGYGHWLHGEAVAIGMCYAAQVSVAVEGFPAADAGRIRALLGRFGLPVAPAVHTDQAWEALRAAMMLDKKTLKKRPRFVLARNLGAVVSGCEVDEAVLTEAWHGFGK
jgi:3-dehydroquinate synthase